MAEGDLIRPLSLIDFVSEEYLDQAKKIRGPKLEDGTAQRDKTLYEILKANKDKKDEEIKEKYKHKPPKALDEDEIEFLDRLQMSQKRHEQSVKQVEAEELQIFHDAVKAQENIANGDNVMFGPLNKPEEKKVCLKRSLGSRIVMKVKPKPKKVKNDVPKVDEANKNVVLVSYGDDSDED